MDADTWYAEGANHRVENGHIRRDMPLASHQQFCWIVELETLEALTAFCQKYASIKIDPPSVGSWSRLPTMQIVDDYL
jgi:hypothetical protein